MVMVALAAGVPLFANPEFWVGVAFLLFCGLMVYVGVPKLVTGALDQRADRIRGELDEARKLREEAQQLLADYQRKAREAETEAQAIVEQAKAEATALAAETRRTLAETVERRTRLAEEKIQRAEAQALGEVRSAAVDAAVAASEKILQSRLATGASTLVDEGIQSVRAKLN